MKTENTSNGLPIFTLRELVKSCLKLFEYRQARVVFFKEGKTWLTYHFEMPAKISDIETLKYIKNIDDKAVVMSRKKFIADWKNTLISLDDMVSQIEYERNQAQCNCNICNFIKIFEEEQNGLEKLKFDKQQFLQSEWGKKLLDYTENLYQAHQDKKPNIMYWLMIVQTALLPLKQVYDVYYTIDIDDKACKVISSDGKDVLCQFG